MKNKKGFTLIELLAVIVILGIILVIAIPSISAAILNSRKNAYIATANEFVDGLRMMTLTNASLLPTDGSKECKALTAIKLEKGSNTKSPFGKKYTENSQVCVKYDGDKKSYT
ncbi:MAG: prepilin-type N-terminal cleavage/methylation domain-containing protein, partial [Tenericutes bacterium]|nr:prepilin-type N-terminal cleavage/methylation domain-containing protein [Mycoplasmatota bacterium]